MEITAEFVIKAVLFLSRMGKDKKKKTKPRTKPRNYVLGGSGIMRFSGPRMYKKKALHRANLKKAREERKKAEKPKVEKTIKKEIGGEKNGGHRIVRVKRMVSTTCTTFLFFSYEIKNAY